MNRYNSRVLSIFITILLIFFVANSAYACKCIGPYKDAQDMYNQADIVFYGGQVLPIPKSESLEFSNYKKDTFEISRIAKSSIPLGTRKLITNKSTAWKAMCGGHYQYLHDYLVFIKINPSDKSLQTMDECYSDVVSVENMQYHFRNQDFAEFSFFKVNPLSAVNGEMPLYADTMSEIQVREFALQEAREWRRKNEPASTLEKTYEITAISRQHDEYRQPYWDVRIEATGKDRAKGDFEIVHIYNTSHEGVIIYPGK